MNFERCTSSDAIIIPSASSASKTYTVSFKELIPTCTCVAYAIGRNRSKSNKPRTGKSNTLAHCKHVEWAHDKGVCRWRGETPLFPGICPECGGPTEKCEAGLEMFN